MGIDPPSTRAHALITRVLERPTPEVIEELLASDLILWVGLKDYDDQIVFACERLLQTGTLTAETPAPGALRIRYRERLTEVPLRADPGDRHVTVHALGRALAPDYEIRFCLDTMDSTDLAFAVLTPDDWNALEARHGDAVGERFMAVQATPNLITDVIDRPRPRVERGSASERRSRDAWKEAVEDAELRTFSEPYDVPCTQGTWYVLEQLRLGGLDVERVRVAMPGAPPADRALVRCVVACCDGDARRAARDVDAVTALDALAFLGPQNPPPRSVPRDDALAIVWELIDGGKVESVAELDALDRALAAILTRADFNALDPDRRAALTRRVHRLYDAMEEHAPRRWDQGRWAPHSIEIVGDVSSLELLKRHTARVMEVAACPSNQARAALGATLHEERLQRFAAARSAAPAPEAAPPPPTHARHRKFGTGEIVRFIEGGKIEVRFGAETRTMVASVLELFTPDATG